MKVRLVESPLAIPRYRQVRLPTVAAELAPYADVEINDENIEPVDFSSVDLVGFTAQAYNAPRAIYLSNKFRQMGIKTMVGGPYATALPQQALEHFDAVVAGEVEGLGERMINDLSAGRLAGIYRLDEPPQNWGERLPRRDLQKADEYYWFNYPIELSRGCPHGCSFCFCRYANPGYRTRSLDSIAGQVEQWDHGLIEAVDWNFAADREFTLRVCRLFEEMGVGAWMGEATLRALDDEEVLGALARSNFKAAFVGIESIDQDTLQSVNKEFNQVSEYRRIIRRIQDHGIFVHAGLIWGLDGQTEETFQATAEFCEENGLYLVSPNIATYFPGTPEHSQLRRQGKLLTQEARKYDGTHVVVEPDRLSVEQVYQGARRFSRRFYSLRSILKRSLQAPNFNLFQLLSFWGFNRNYRDYYKMWGRKLGGEQMPWRTPPDEVESYPHVGGPMPRRYAVNDAYWRRAHRWHMAWYRPPERASAVLTGFLVLLVAAASLLAFVHTRQAAARHWPMVWPPAAPVVGVFIALTLVCTWLMTRLARIDIVNASPESVANSSPEPNNADSKPEPRQMPLAKRLALFCGVATASAPLYLCAWAFHQVSSGWSFIASWLSVVFFMKSRSVVTAPYPGIRSPERVTWFILFFPTLDFESAFVFDATPKLLTRHLWLASAGLLKTAAGLVLLPALFYLSIRDLDAVGFGLPGALGRALVLYLLLAGILEMSTAWFRLWGYAVEAPFAPRPFGPAGFCGLWNRWNLPMRRFLIRQVYIPLGGRNRPFFATAVTFLVSGALFAIMFYPVVRSLPHQMFFFFGACGLAAAIEKKALAGRQPGRALLHFLYAASALFLLYTSRWFFELNDRIFL